MVVKKGARVEVKMAPFSKQRGEAKVLLYRCLRGDFWSTGSCIFRNEGRETSLPDPSPRSTSVESALNVHEHRSPQCGY